ncbi:MAG: inorganic phosphate transporter [Planctomycetota bacterium]
MHIYSIIGVPVSTSQAVVGAIFGIGLIKGIKTVSFKSLFKILLGWIMTPIIGLTVAYVIIKTFL